MKLNVRTILVLPVLIISVFLLATANMNVKESNFENLTSLKVETGNFGGKQVTQIETDENYPCYLQSNGKVICPAIKKEKLDSLKLDLKDKIKDVEIKDNEKLKETELDKAKDELVDEKILLGIPKTDLRKSKFIFNKTENWTDEHGVKWQINVSTFDGYEEEYLDYNVEQTFDLDYSLDGKVRVGFASNVFEISDFVFGSSENCTAKSYGVVLENTHADSDASMVGHWKFTDDATDSSGNGNDGTVIGATHNFSWYEFDGVNDYVDYGNGGSLNSSFTFSLWIKDQQTQSFSYLTPFQVGSVSTDSRMQLIFFNSSRKLQLKLTNNSINLWEKDLGYLDLNWNNIIVSYDGTQMRGYFNGIETASSTSMSGDLSFNSFLRIGSANYGNSFFNGSIDEVAIYNRSLNSTEITALYNKGLYRQQGNYTSGILDAGQKVNWTNINWTYSNKTENQNVSMFVRTGSIAKPDFADSSLVSMWSLNQTDRDGNTAIDTMGRNNGTAEGGLSIGGVGGVFQGENATEFDGVDDYVDMNYQLNQTNSGTINVWINSKELTTEDRIVSGELSNKRGIVLWQEGKEIKALLTNVTSVLCSIETTGDFILGWTGFHYLTFTWNSSYCELFVDGISQDSDTYTGSVSANTKLRMGMKAYTDGSDFNGSIAYVSIFNKSLTQDEIMNWSTYTGELLISQGETLDLPINRFLQYKANLKTNTSETPILTDVKATYNTCACPGLGNNWEIYMYDYCNITSACNLGTGKLSFTGSGITRMNSTINTTNLGSPGANGKLYILDSCRINIA